MNQPCTQPCPLCSDQGPHQQLQGADKRRYFSCSQCSLAFADPQQWLSADDEKAYYATHENSIEDAGYVQFLQHLLTFPQLGARSICHELIASFLIPNRNK